MWAYASCSGVINEKVYCYFDIVCDFDAASVDCILVAT